MKTYQFNGQQMTMVELTDLLGLSRTSIAKHIDAGRNTSAAITTHNPARKKPGRGSQFRIGKTHGFARDAPSKMR